MINSNPDLEKKLLSGLLQHRTFLDTHVDLVTSLFFTQIEHQNIFISLKKYYEKYKTLLSEDAYTATLDRSSGDFDVMLSYIPLFKELKALVVDPGELRFVYQELKDLKTRRQLFTLSHSLDKELDTGKTSEELLKKLRKSVTEIEQEHHDIKVTRRELTETLAERKELYMQRKSGLYERGALFGFKELDDLTEGMQKEELGIIIARSGVGKSRMLFNMGYNMACQNKYVMYISIEMYCSQVEKMFDSRAAYVSSFRLKKGKLNPDEEQRYMYFIEQVKGKTFPFYLVDMPSGCTVETLDAELDNYEVKHNHPVDVLIVDYLMLMQSPKDSNLSVQYGDLTKRLKQLARARKTVILTAAQTNRKAVEAAEVNTEHISYSDAIGWNADTVLSLSQTKQEKAQNIMALNVIKYRDGGNRILKLYCDFDHSFIGDCPPVYPGRQEGVSNASPSTEGAHSSGTTS